MAVAYVMLLFILFIPSLVLSLRCFVGDDCLLDKLFDSTSVCYFAIDEKTNKQMCGGKNRSQLQSYGMEAKDGECLFNQEYKSSSPGAQPTATICFCNQHNLCNVKSYFPILSTTAAAPLTRSPTKKGVSKCWSMSMHRHISDLREETCLRNDDGKLPSYCYLVYDSFDHVISLAGCQLDAESCKISSCCDTDMCNDITLLYGLNPQLPKPDQYPVKGVTKCLAPNADFTKRNDFVTVLCVPYSDGKFPKYCYIRYSKSKNVDDYIIKDSDCDWQAACDNITGGTHIKCNDSYCCCDTNMCNDHTILSSSNRQPSPPVHHPKKGVTKCWASNMTRDNALHSVLIQKACVEEDGEFPKYCYISYDKTHNIILAAGCEKSLHVFTEVGCESKGLVNKCETRTLGPHCCCDTNMCNDKSWLPNQQTGQNDRHSSDLDYQEGQHYPNGAGDRKDQHHLNGPDSKWGSHHPDNKATKIGWAPMLLMIALVFVGK